MRFIVQMLSSLALMSGIATAQVVEVGGGIGRGCIGDSSGFCGNRIGGMPSAHASVWLGDRLEIGLRIASLRMPGFTYSILRDDRFNAVDDPAVREIARIDVSSDSQSRRIQSVDTIYHFNRTRPVRLMLGLGLGSRTERFTQTCLPAGCERLMSILQSPVGRNSYTARNITVVAGLSTRVRERVQLRGGVRFHNFAGEEASTTELFVAAGYRFGR